MKRIRELLKTILWLGGLALVIYFGVNEQMTNGPLHWIHPQWLP